MVPLSQQFMVGQPHALVQTPLIESQQDLSALQQVVLAQQEPDAQQLPPTQQDGTGALPLARTGAQAVATSASAAKRVFVTSFISIS